MACETLTAASTRNVNNTANESHWKTTRNRGETFRLSFITAIVLRVRLGSGRPPGPHAGVVTGVNCLADDIEPTIKAITKANKRVIGEIIRKYCKTLWAVSKMSEGSVISDDISESGSAIAQDLSFLSRTGSSCGTTLSAIPCHSAHTNYSSTLGSHSVATVEYCERTRRNSMYQRRVIGD